MMGDIRRDEKLVLKSMSLEFEVEMTVEKFINNVLQIDAKTNLNKKINIIIHTK